MSKQPELHPSSVLTTAPRRLTSGTLTLGVVISAACFLMAGAAEVIGSDAIVGDMTDVTALIDGLFAQVGWKFIVNRGNPEAFEPAPDPDSAALTPKAVAAPAETYNVHVDGKNYQVTVGPAGAELQIQPSTVDQTQTAAPPSTPTPSKGTVVDAPMAGNILKVNVSAGSAVAEGDVVVIMEAMKMETEVRSPISGIVEEIYVNEHDGVAVGDALLSIA